MRVFTIFILPETLASASRLSHATRDWTQAEMTSWNQLCTEIQGLKGNGSGFIEKLHRGKSLTHLRELINSEKSSPNYEDDYSGEYEEIEEILYDVPSADYAMLNDVDSSFEDFDMKLPYQNAEEYVVVKSFIYNILKFYRATKSLRRTRSSNCPNDTYNDCPRDKTIHRSTSRAD
jgi:hypothetical protein